MNDEIRYQITGAYLTGFDAALEFRDELENFNSPPILPSIEDEALAECTSLSDVVDDLEDKLVEMVISMEDTIYGNDSYSYDSEIEELRREFAEFMDQTELKIKDSDANLRSWIGEVERLKLTIINQEEAIEYVTSENVSLGATKNSWEAETKNAQKEAEWLTKDNKEWSKLHAEEVRQNTVAIGDRDYWKNRSEKLELEIKRLERVVKINECTVDSL